MTSERHESHKVDVAVEPEPAEFLQHLSEILREAPVYRKQGVYHARPAVPGEVVETVVYGVNETANTAKEGDMVMTGPLGEEWIVPRSVFERRYSATEQAGVYHARGYVRAVQNTSGSPVTLLAEWGEEQHGDTVCYVAATCDEEGGAIGQPYIIAEEAFVRTYRRKEVKLE